MAKEPGVKADGSLVVRTPRSLQRPNVRLSVMVALVALFGAACSATPSWISVETADSLDAGIDPPPAELAFVEDSASSASEAFCTASANIWTHSAALSRIGAEASPEMNQIAMANVAEWLERSTLFTEDEAVDRRAMFKAFDALQTTAGKEFGFDWAGFQASTEYADDPDATAYEAARTDLVSFINEHCDSLSMVDLGNEAEARAGELRASFAVNPSTLVESESLPGHAIFTHSSGRLIASFPSKWDHEEGRGDAIVDLIASSDIEGFLTGGAFDGVRLQLVEAPTVDDFRSLIDDTMIAGVCIRTNDLLDNGLVRTNITQSYECADHGATIIGQYNEDRGLGLIIEASFDRVEASRADLIRLASIANSALWS